MADDVAQLLLVVEGHVADHGLADVGGHPLPHERDCQGDLVVAALLLLCHNCLSFQDGVQFLLS